MWECVPHGPVWVVRAHAFHVLDRTGIDWLAGLAVKLVQLWTKLILAGVRGVAVAVVHLDGDLDDEAVFVATHQSPFGAIRFLGGRFTCFDLHPAVQ
jgi:hypothetical protein